MSSGPFFLTLFQSCFNVCKMIYLTVVGFASRNHKTAFRSTTEALQKCAVLFFFSLFFKICNLNSSVVFKFPPAVTVCDFYVCVMKPP